MPRVEIAPTAQAELDRLVRSRELPATTKPRVWRSLRSLRRFPQMGAQLSGKWRGFRYVFGPWRWMLIVYAFDESNDRVTVVTVEDARTSSAATGSR